MISVTLYSRKDCHLCEQALADLASLSEEIPHDIRIVDVESDPKLLRAYGLEIPVIVIGPYTLKAPITRQDLLLALRATHMGEQQNAAIDQKIASGEIRIPTQWTTSDKISYWFSSHYLAVFNLFVLIYIGLPFLAPVLMKIGATAPAAVIYRTYSLMCHQLPYRSWFLFGEQAVYPRATAQMNNLKTFNEVTGLSEANDALNYYAAREFTGTNALGYKVALCERDVAIWGAMLVFGLLFSILRLGIAQGWLPIRKIPPLPWYLWVLLGILPMGLDGGSQLISQLLPEIPRLPMWLLQLLPYRESTPFLRTLTGGLFGLTTAWFGYPMVEESMTDSIQFLESRRARAERQG